LAVTLWLALTSLAAGQAAKPGDSIARNDRAATSEPAATTPDGDASPPAYSSASICGMVRSAAWDNNLPVDFFARVIWQESRFRPDAVGPVTRGGQHALGIA
jgi:soluble lytic murein transglycosylase-like protein